MPPPSWVSITCGNPYEHQDVLWVKNAHIVQFKSPRTVWCSGLLQCHYLLIY